MTQVAHEYNQEKPYVVGKTIDEQLEELERKTRLLSFFAPSAGLEHLLSSASSLPKPDKQYQTDYEILAELVDTYQESAAGVAFKEKHKTDAPFVTYEFRKFDDKNVFAAYEPGTGTLIFNEETRDLVLAYIADPSNPEIAAAIENALTHEGIHALGDHDEASTYQRTGEILKELASKTGDENYAHQANESLTIADYLSNSSNPEQAYSKLLSGEVGPKELGLEGLTNNYANNGRPKGGLTPTNCKAYDGPPSSSNYSGASSKAA